MYERAAPEITLSIAGKKETALQLHRFTGTERISHPFTFLLTCVSNKSDFSGKSMIGKPLALSFPLTEKARVFHGMITEFTQGVTIKIQDLPLTEYQIQIQPSLHLLSLGSDYRIYQQQTALEILKGVLKDNGVTEVQDKTQKCGQAVRPYCVQYGETFFDFFSRLCEEEGISYYFLHTEQAHTLVLADAPDAFSTIPGGAPIPFLSTFVESPPLQHILSCSVHDRLVPKGYETGDYNYELPKTELKAQVRGTGYEGTVVEYPGHFANVQEGTQRTNLRIQELELPAHGVDGESTVIDFFAGGSFSMKGHARAEVNTSYILEQVEHHFSVDSPANAATPLYKNHFRAVPKTTPVRPVRHTPKNLIQGAQTAIVTGPPNTEIHRGPHGAIKVFFFWDRHGKRDDSSSCWVRTSQALASRQFGGVFTPRVGDEVLVVFEGGDPERPIVVGGVYNGENPPPYPEKEATKSGLKTHSSPNAEGYNEWFLEDEAGKEKGYLYLQKDGEALVKDSLKITLEKGDETRLYQEGSRTTTLEAGGDKEGNETLHLVKGTQKTQIDKGNYELSLGEGNAQFTIQGDTAWQIEGSRTTTVKKDVTLTVQGGLTIKVAGEILLQGEKDVTLKADKNLLLQAGQNITLKAGQNMTVQAGQDISQKAANIKVAASMNYTVKASMAYKAEGQVNAEVKAGIQLKLGAATIASQAQAVFEVKAPAITIGGGMVKLG
ncbi:MAG: type VI secretion system tip protein VgrG [Holosporales bacterium]|jgi:type VI secretion system secreted protein VgrG|nr:type VI secretion system tip protein VgrG [Holosporales bacterium]